MHKSIVVAALAALSVPVVAPAQFATRAEMDHWGRAHSPEIAAIRNLKQAN